MILELIFALGASSGQETPPPEPGPKISIEDEVLGNVKAQPIGPATVDDLALPDPYLRRVSDRIIRSSFETRYRIVVPDAAVTAGPVPPKSAPAQTGIAANPALWTAIIAAGIALVLGAVFVASRRNRKSAP